MKNEEREKELILLFTLFEIVQTFMYSIKDTFLRQRAKQFFNVWLNEGRRLAVALNINIKKTDDPEKNESRYEDGQAYILDALEILWSIPEEKREEFIAALRQSAENHEQAE